MRPGEVRPLPNRPALRAGHRNSLGRCRALRRVPMRVAVFLKGGLNRPPLKLSPTTRGTFGAPASRPASPDRNAGLQAGIARQGETRLHGPQQHAGRRPRRHEPSPTSSGSVGGAPWEQRALRDASGRGTPPTEPPGAARRASKLPRSLTRPSASSDARCFFLERGANAAPLSNSPPRFAARSERRLPSRHRPIGTPVSRPASPVRAKPASIALNSTPAAGRVDTNRLLRRAVR